MSADPTLRADLDRATATLQAARFAEAATLLQSVLARDPSIFAAWTNLAGALAQLSRFDEALAASDKALALKPGDPRALNNKALALNALNRPEEALACFDTALAANPGHVSALINRGAALQALGRDDDAVASIDRALQIEPQNASAHYYRAMSLYLLNCRAEALAAFDTAMRLDPSDADFAYSKGVALLAFGQWREAWPLFEQRWRAKRVRVLAPRDRGEPRWDGAPLTGLLRVWTEQGVGDQVLFAGLLPLAHERAPRIALECDSRLAPLFRRSFPWLESVTARNAHEPQADAQCALGGLGAALDVAPDALAARESYLVADPHKRADTRTRYETLAQGRPIIGISWFSQNPEFGRAKSSALDDWGELLSRDCFFVNLQYHADAAEIAAAEANYKCVIHTDPHVDQITDLDAFAAQIAAVDRVISVSNSGVHLAGALGAPCTLLAPRGRGLLWYWGVEGETTPWYRSVRITRAALGESWREQIARAAASLPDRV